MGRKRDDRGMDPEDGVLAHNLCISVTEVKRIVVDGRLLLVGFDAFTEPCWGQI